MAWLTNPADFGSGSTPTATDYANLIADQHTWGANIGAAHYGLLTLSYLQLKAGALPGTNYTVTGASWTSSVATYTIGTNSFAPGQLVTVSGASPSGWNVVQASITAVTSTTFSIAMTSAPGTWTSGGTAQSGGVSAIQGYTAIDNSNFLWNYNGTTATWMNIRTTLASILLIGQTSNISSTNLLAVTPVAGLYQVCGMIAVTSVGSTSTLPSYVSGFIHMDSGASASLTTATNTGNSTSTAVVSITHNVACVAGTAITYSTTGYASTGTAMQYSIHANVSYLGS